MLDSSEFKLSLYNGGLILELPSINNAAIPKDSNGMVSSVLLYSHILLQKNRDPMPDDEKARHLMTTLPNLRAHNKPTIPYLVLHTSNHRFLRHHLADCHRIYCPWPRLSHLGNLMAFTHPCLLWSRHLHGSEPYDGRNEETGVKTDDSNVKSSF